MLLTKTVMVRWTEHVRQWYELKGYIYTKKGDIFEVKVEDLTNGSGILVDVKCDNPDCKNPYLKPIRWKDYLLHLHDDKSYCNSCATEFFAREKIIKTRLNNSKSFEKWCIENNRQDVLDRWDYELNKCNPNEICYSSTGINKKGYWFKCLNHPEHRSELKNINSLSSGCCENIRCSMCNSFAQWGIDNICSDFLEKYWDYDKNIDIDPWKISYCIHKKAWFKCQNKEKSYHESYNLLCSDFVAGGQRCPYCSSKKIHPLDSLGKLLEDKGLLDMWSDKNEKSPYKYSHHTQKKVWWKCHEGKHEDYCRKVSDSNRSNFRCPECSNSKGEIRISEYLINNKINYIPQKEFCGLLGLGNKNLSYDFYLKQYNLLIEYQGEQHEQYISGFHASINIFKKQQEHDRRKKEYAENNNIQLLEIWYRDFDNIEKILDKELKVQNSSNYQECIDF